MYNARMVTPGVFVKALDEILGVPEKTGIVFDRFLKQAGLLTKHGRGPGSAHRTPLDAARITTAMLVTESPARAVDAVLDFGPLRCRGNSALNPTFERPLNFIDLCDVPEAGTFADHLAALFAAASTESFREQIRAADHERIDEDTGKRWVFVPFINIIVRSSFLEVEIVLNGRAYDYHSPPTADDLELQKKYRGIQTTREIGIVEIVKIAEVLAGIPESESLYRGRKIPTAGGLS